MHPHQASFPPISSHFATLLSYFAYLIIIDANSIHYGGHPKDIHTRRFSSHEANILLFFFSLLANYLNPNSPNDFLVFISNILPRRSSSFFLFFYKLNCKLLDLYWIKTLVFIDSKSLNLFTLKSYAIFLSHEF